MQEQKAQIVALFRPGPKGEVMEQLDRAEAIANFGFKGDRKAKPDSKRQVLLLDSETIRDYGFEPGDLDENITTAGLSVSDLKRGQQVRIGDVLLEVTIERPACHKLEELRPGLAETLRHRRGMMAVVVHGGEIRIGDEIELVGSGTGSA